MSAKQKKTLATVAVWIAYLLFAGGVAGVADLFGGFSSESRVYKMVATAAAVVATTITVFIWLKKPTGGSGPNGGKS